MTTTIEVVYSPVGNVDISNESTFSTVSIESQTSSVDIAFQPAHLVSITNEQLPILIELDLATIGPKGDQGNQGEKGDIGDAGPANTLAIGTVSTGLTASATIIGTSPNQTLNLVLPKGDKGDTGSSGDAGSLGGYPVMISNPSENDVISYVGGSFINKPQTDITDGGNY